MEALYTPAMPGIAPSPERDTRLPSLQKALSLCPPGGGDLSEQDEQSLVAQMEQIAREWYDNSRWYYQEDVECRANVNGDQLGYYSIPESRYITCPAPRNTNQVRLVINAMGAVVDQATGALTSEEPIFAASAAKSDVQDSASQAAADEFIDWAWRAHGLAGMYTESGHDVFSTGNSILHVQWDRTAGAPVEMVSNPDGSVTEAGNAGDWRFDLLPRESYAPDPSAKNQRDGAGVFIQERVTIDQLMVDYPERWSEAREEMTGDDNNGYQDWERVEQAARASPLDNIGIQMDQEDRGYVTRYTFYGRKTPTHPRGVMLVFGGGVVFYKGDNPKLPTVEEKDSLWPTRQWPVFHMICKPRGISAWGQGRAVHMINPQRALNGTVSKALQHVAMISNAKVTVPTNLAVDWNDEIGQVIPVGRNVNPNLIGYVNPASLPPEYFTMWNSLKAELEYIGGMSASTMGQAATNVESGRQAEGYVKRDLGRLDPVKRRLDRVWGEAVEYMLQLFRRHADTPRKVLIAGENNTTSVRYFDKTSFATPVNIRVMNDQSIPRDPTQRSLWMTQFVQNYAAMGHDPKGRSVMLKMYRLRDFEGVLSELSQDEVKALRLVQKLMLGEAPIVLPSDDPLIFKRVIDDWMKTEEWEKRVEEERAAMGVSPLEQASIAYATYYTQQASAAMAPPAAPMAPAAPAGAPMAA